MLTIHNIIALSFVNLHGIFETVFFRYNKTITHIHPMAPTPATDTHIHQKYSITSLEQKVRNKTALQEEIGWAPEPKRPMVCFPLGMTEALGGERLKELLPGILAMPVELLVLGKGSETYGSLFTNLEKKHKHRIHIVAERETDLHLMYAAADMALFLTEPPAKELQLCLTYGVVPVSVPCEKLENYNPVQESGNAFLTEGDTSWHNFAALVRALETYKFPFDWRTIQRHCMESVRAK